MYEFAKGPLGIGQQVDQAIKLTRHIYLSALGVVLLTVSIGVLSAFTNTSFVEQADDIGSIGASAWAGFIIFTILTVYLYFLLVIQICYRAFGLGDMVDAMTMSFKKLFPLIGLYLGLVLAVSFGMILLIVPGMILVISLSLSMYCMVLEGTGPIESLKRSHSLVWGNWMRTAMVFSVGGLLLIVFYFIVVFVSATVIFTSDPDSIQFWTSVLTSAITPFAQPFLIAMGLVIYNDVRVRKEGGDLEDQIENL
ncbi:MAG: hypothetical protein ACJAR0_001384 [Candidatus Azotimanducaceae bacterium]|jgi:hypothetical protein